MKPSLIALIIFIVFVLAVDFSNARAQVVQRENFWRILLSEQYIQCSGFLMSASEVLEKNYPTLASKIQNWATDSLVRGMLAFKLEFPDNPHDSNVLHVQLRLNKYREIWRDDLPKVDEGMLKEQWVSCKSILPQFDIEWEDFLKSTAI